MHPSGRGEERRGGGGGWLRTDPLDGWRTERVFEEFLRLEMGGGRRREEEGGGCEAGEGKFISMGHVKTLPRKEARVSRLPERVDNRGSSRRRLTLTPFLDHRCSALGQRARTGWLKSCCRVCGTFGKIDGIAIRPVKMYPLI